MSQDQRPLVGGKYQVIEPIKTGGTALIELAIMRGENNFSREVVLKRPLPHLLADRSLRAMFLDEAHLASRLAHPNVVQVIDLVARDDEIFLVLEYLRGRDLREVIKRGTERGRVVPPDIAAYITAEAAAGLGYAHDATTPDGVPLGLVHRDVSPKNLRITDNGAVKVIDFGIARAEFRQSETAPGSVKGTLGYMSPEQVLGEAVDRRSDIFSLGICLFQMLTGRNPFDGGTLRERVSKLIQEPIPHVRELVPDVDARLEAIVERALERDLDRRYPRMEALARDLEAYLADLRLASPRQRLVAHLESLFPDLHQLPPRLQEALSNSSSLSARGGRGAAGRRPRGPRQRGHRAGLSGPGVARHGRRHAQRGHWPERVLLVVRAAGARRRGRPRGTTGARCVRAGDAHRRHAGAAPAPDVGRGGRRASLLRGRGAVAPDRPRDGGRAA
jgi:serine/threonine protein kinase